MKKKPNPQDATVKDLKKLRAKIRDLQKAFIRLELSVRDLHAELQDLRALLPPKVSSDPFQ